MTKEEVDEYLRETTLRMSPQRRQYFAEHFEYDIDIIDEMQIGVDLDRRAWVWPMFDGYGTVIGFRLRSLDTGKKWALKGSRSGIFKAGPVGEDDLWVVEGPTDCAALACLGLWCVGLPSINSGYQCVRDYLTLHKRERNAPNRVVWVVENDDAGERFEDMVVKELLKASLPVVSIRIPPSFKDARDCYLAGMTKEVFTAYANSQEPRYG